MSVNILTMPVYTLTNVHAHFDNVRAQKKFAKPTMKESTLEQSELCFGMTEIKGTFRAYFDPYFGDFF